MAEDWDFYMAPVDDHTASIFVDLARNHDAPDGLRPWLLRVTVLMQSPRDDGLSDEAETERLFAIEDELFAQVARGLSSRYVGRITSQGRREYFFYGRSANGFSDAVAQAMTAFPEYRFESQDQADPEWNTYANLLYPSDLDLQSINNRRLVERMESQGDDLTAPRDIDHWIYFPNEDSRDRFLLQVAGEGFRSECFQAEDEAHPSKFGVHLIRRDRIDLTSIDGLVIDLFLRAQNCDGDYDGWGAPVMRGL